MARSPEPARRENSGVGNISGLTRLRSLHLPPTESLPDTISSEAVVQKSDEPARVDENLAGAGTSIDENRY
jgi:hypothetical protein